MATPRRYAFGAITVLAGLVVLLPAETLTAAPNKTNLFGAARCSPCGRAVARIAPATLALWPLARPTTRRVEHVVLQLGVGF